MPGTLSEIGKKQIKSIAKRLKEEEFDKIYSSDLKRCVDTTKEIIKYHPNTEVIYDTRLRERSRGIFEGKTHEEIKNHMKENNLEYKNFKPKGGETFDEVTKRVSEFIDEIIEKDHGKNILVVTHGGPKVHTMLHLLEGYESSNIDKIKNTSLSIFELNKEKKYELTLFNCTKHLE